MTDNGTQTLRPVRLNERTQEHVTQLCTNIFAAAGQAPKRVAIAAAEPGEGKTSLGLALAVQTCQLMSAKVLFVEANLRAPKVARIIGAPRGAKGLADVLSGNTSVAEAILSLGEGYPDVMPAGTAENRDGIVKDMNRNVLQQKLSELDKLYEYIIVETPAINRFPESQILVSLMDQTLLVVRAGVTSREAAAIAVKRIEMAGSKPPMMVLNRKRYYVPNFLYKRL